MPRKTTLILVENIQTKIVTLRGQRVILDNDLALLYGVTTKRLNEQVRRNQDRFPDDFMFQLTAEEAASLRSQNATLKPGRGQHRKYLPYAFTEHGTIMAANVLNSPTAVEVSVHVVRAFVKLRELVLTRKELSRKLAELEQKVGSHDEAIRQLIQAIRKLAVPVPPPPRGRIGFGRENEKPS